MPFFYAEDTGFIQDKFYLETKTQFVCQRLGMYVIP